MKQKTQYILIILTLMSTFIYGQTATVEIQNMTYLNGGSISNCGTIDFEDNASITVQFGIQLEKPSSLVIGTANLKVLTKTTSSNSPNTEDS
jgi:hypothetical protein